MIGLKTRQYYGKETIVWLILLNQPQPGGRNMIFNGPKTGSIINSDYCYTSMILTTKILIYRIIRGT